MLKQGFKLGKAYPISIINGYILPISILILFLLLVVRPSFIIMTNSGHAPILVSLIAGIIIGIIGQRTKLCFVSGFRNLFAIGDISLLGGFFSLIVFAGLTNIILGNFHLGIHKIGS